MTSPPPLLDTHLFSSCLMRVLSGPWDGVQGTRVSSSHQETHMVCPQVALGFEERSWGRGAVG